MCGITLSKTYITKAPIKTPATHNSGEENSILSGISSKKEIANITPAAKLSMLYMKSFDGFLITPIKDPIIGPNIEIIRMNIIGSIEIINC